MDRVGTLEIGRLAGHPRNREFVRSGPEWEAWLEDLYLNGIQTHLTVRPRGEEEPYQVIKGHRRMAGWEELARRYPKEQRFVGVPVLFKEMTDEEALKELFRDNLLAEKLDPVEEGRMVVALREDLGITEEQVAGIVCRSVEWVRTRQMLLDLGDEVLACVRKPKGDDRHMDMGTVEEILAVPAELREEAVQMVLHCDIFTGVPRRSEAAKLLRQGLLEPHAQRVAWEKGLAALVKEWKKRLKEFLGKKLSAGLNVQGVAWDGVEGARRGGVAAECHVVEEERDDSAPERLCWAALAVRHHLPVLVVPDSRPGHEGESLALVNEPAIRQMEEAAREAGESAWLAGKRRTLNAEHRTLNGTAPDCPSEAGASRSQVGEALADVEGESSPAWENEEDRRAEATVVEQSIERTTVIRMDEVVRLREGAEGWLNEPVTIEGLTDQAAIEARGGRYEAFILSMPEWARADHLFLEDVVEICRWVEGLKYTPAGNH